MVDWIPVLSQLKSAIQWAAGQDEKARATQENFINRCPVVSQVKAGYEVYHGHSEDALETQWQFLENTSYLMNSVPIVGHVKGLIHFTWGDYEGSLDAMKLSTRASGVMLGGIGGLAVAGPGGSIGGGLAAGAAMDSIFTGVGSLAHEEFVPDGYWNSAIHAYKGDLDLTESVDIIFGILSDSVGGYTSAKFMGHGAGAGHGFSKIGMVQQGACGAGRTRDRDRRKFQPLKRKILRRHTFEGVPSLHDLQGTDSNEKDAANEQAPIKGASSPCCPNYRRANSLMGDKLVPTPRLEEKSVSGALCEAAEKNA